MLVALLGGLVGALGTPRQRSAAGGMVHFAAGALVAGALLHLLPEAAEYAGWGPAAAAALAGFALCTALARRVGPPCPACTLEGGHEAVAHPMPAPEPDAAELRLEASLPVVIAVHSLLDGLALTGVGEHAHAADAVSLAVLAHKLPEGIAVAALCRAMGRSKGAALGITAALEAFTFVGAGAGTLLGWVNPSVLGLGLGAVVGSFVYLASLTFNAGRQSPNPARNAGTAAAGAFLMLIVRVALGPGH